MSGLPSSVVGAVSGARWASGTLAEARGQLRTRTLPEIRIAPPPAAPRGFTRGALMLLRLRRASCLERSLVLQRCLAARGEPCDVVVGVRGPRDFAAHAWLDGDPEPARRGFVELSRIRP